MIPDPKQLEWVSVRLETGEAAWAADVGLGIYEVVRSFPQGLMQFDVYLNTGLIAVELTVVSAQAFAYIHLCRNLRELY